MLVPGNIFPTWRHDLFICMLPAAVVLFSPDLFMYVITCIGEFQDVFGSDTAEDSPCVCLRKKEGRRRLLGGVWAGYLV